MTRDPDALPPTGVTAGSMWKPGLASPVDDLRLATRKLAEAPYPPPDPFRPASEILTIIEEMLSVPEVPPPAITLDVALATNPDEAWPCMDFCCTLGCPGPGNSLCRVAMSSGECRGWCTCGQSHIRDVVRELQVVVRGMLKPGPLLIVGPPATWAPIPEPCTRPRWLPTALHFHACPGGAP